MRRKGSRPDRVLLLVTGGRDRELLEAWLASEAGYAVVELDDPEDLGTVEYDVCLVDRASFARYGERLLARRDSAAPCYLPALLVVPDRGEGRTGDERAVPTGGTALEVFDDVVELPVEKATLRRRLENLLRGRHASLDLAAREEQYRELVRLTPEAILLVRDGRVVYGNHAAGNLFGADGTAELAGCPVTDLAAEPGVGRFQQVVAAVERDGDLGEFVEVELVLADGSERTVELAGVTVTYEGEPTTQLIVRDVTDERRRNERLTLYARAIEAAAQGVTITDARREDRPLIYVNPAFERITGYDASDVLGRSPGFLRGEGTDHRTAAEVDEAIDARRPISVELRNYRADGTPFWNRLDLIPVGNDAGEVTHFLGLHRDVTQRREREQRVAVLDRVLRHNLRNQLNVVRGEADRILVDEGVDPAEARDAADGIVRATDRLLDIADQARRFREVIGGDHRKPGVSDVAGAFAEVVGGIDAEYHDATVDVDLPEDLRVYAHDVVWTAFAGVVEMLAETSDGRVHVAVRATDVGPGTVTIEILDRASGFRAADLDVVAGGAETQITHPQGVDLWLLRWSVEHSGGEFAVDTGGDQPRIRLRLRRAAPEGHGVEEREANADD